MPMLSKNHLYCVRCHSGKTVLEQKQVKMRNGAVALRGRCPSCHNMAYKIVSSRGASAPSSSRSIGSHSGAITMVNNSKYLLNAALLFLCGAGIGAVVIHYLQGL